jgi:ribosomal-protein-alanine acetyltransferase
VSFESFILIGGKSSRMGEDKFSLRLEGKTFLEIAFETLQNFGDVAVVISEKNNQIKKLRVVKDIYKNRGALSGIHAALTHSKSVWTIILACDYPFVSVELIEFLTNFTKTETEFDVFSPIQADGKIQPLCAVYKTENCREILSEMLENSDENYSVRDFLNRIKTRYVEFSEIEHLPNSEHFFFNVNTPEDFILATKIRESSTKKTSIEILKMTADDIDEVMKIQQESNLSYWSFEDYKEEISRQDSFSVVAKINQQSVGFLVGRLIQIENFAELYNIGVNVNFRRKKIGNKLLESFVKLCVKNNLDKIFLEVRESNETAIKFYLKNKFAVIGTRKNFYTNPTEDAILMERKM